MASLRNNVCGVNESGHVATPSGLAAACLIAASMMCVAATTACTAAGAAAGVGVIAIAGTTGALSTTVGPEIEQVYYMGVFDPLEQLPPTIYRITVRGQASVISNTKFASGWVQANLIDSLSSDIGFDMSKDTGALSVKSGGAGSDVNLKIGRRLMLFGPEGFREAPAAHRLVIVMGTSPDAYFNAVDRVLGKVARVQLELAQGPTAQKVLEQMQALMREREQVTDVELAIREDMMATKEVISAN